MRELELERSSFLLIDYRIEKCYEGGVNSMLLHVGDTMDPDELKLPKTSDGWVNPDTKTVKGEPAFDKLDNPGGFSSFSYLPVF